jgi:nucleotidyltransferase/DNA polymerase involved in DNA repair
VTSPWQQVWGIGKQMLLERDHNGAVETVMELRELEEDEWAKFLADWEAL